MNLGTVPGWVLPDFALQERKFMESDGAGGSTISDWDTVNANLQGFLRGGHPSDQPRGSKYEAQVSHVWYSFADADILRGDRLTVTKGSRTYVVAIIGINNPAMADHHLECPCREWQPGIAGQGSEEDDFNG